MLAIDRCAALRHGNLSRIREDCVRVQARFFRVHHVGGTPFQLEESEMEGVLREYEKL